MCLTQLQGRTQQQVISPVSARGYETRTHMFDLCDHTKPKSTWSPVGEMPASPVRESTPVREKLAVQADSTSPVPSGTSPGADLNSSKSDSLPPYISSPKSGEVTSNPPVVPTPASGSQDVAPPPSEVTLPLLENFPTAQPSRSSRGPSQAPVTSFCPLPDGTSPACNRTLDAA